MHLIEEFGADAVRYWASSGRPGADTAFDAQQMRVGRRLAVKLLNASKFALADLPPSGPELTHALDRALVASLAEVTADATTNLEAYDYTRALERTESFFWWYCDFYVELVKGRRYAREPGAAASVSRALRMSLSTLQRLFAPFLPFVTEEVWSWWQEGSVHTATWPDAAELRAAAGDGSAVILDAVAEVLGEIRKAKTTAKRSLRSEVTSVPVTAPAVTLDAVKAAEPDLREAGRIAAVGYAEGDALAVDVELAPEEAA